MHVPNTFTILIQVIFIVFLSLISINILRHFSGGVKKMPLIAPALFVNHGGGPLPLLRDKAHAPLTEFLENGVNKYVDFKSIKAIILVTAHWEENIVSISSGKHHDLYFDYYGFPPESYKYKYEAPGDPELANRIHEALKKENIKSVLDPKRGWDHGVFVPMMLMNPSADIPIVQMSVLKNQDPEQHYRIGQILLQFREDGIAIIGSGMSYHNMREFIYGRGGNEVVNDEFDSYLTAVCTTEDENKRREGLIGWRHQNGASQAHPPRAAEHFMPLIVVAGAGGEKAGERMFNWDMGDSFRLSGFIWRD